MAMFATGVEELASRCYNADAHSTSDRGKVLSCLKKHQFETICSWSATTSLERSRDLLELAGLKHFCPSYRCLRLLSLACLIGRSHLPTMTVIVTQIAEAWGDSVVRPL